MPDFYVGLIVGVILGCGSMWLAFAMLGKLPDDANENAAGVMDTPAANELR